MQKRNKTLLSVLLAGTLLLGAVGVAAADSTTSTSAPQCIKALWQKLPGHGAKAPAEMKAQLSTQLKTLVDKGTITQVQADKVVAYMEKMQQNRSADFDKIKNMTEAERQSYMKQNRNKCQDPLAQLVTDKVLSQNQADAIAQLLPMHMGKGMKGDRQGNPANQAKMEKVLNGLVTKGTLTQNQADNILTAMEKNRTEHQATMEKMKNMTQAERQTYMQQFKENRVDPISQLVKDKVITSPQAEAITSAMPQRPNHGQGR